MVKVGRRTCTCSFTITADGNQCIQPKASCDKKCSGGAKQISLSGENSFMFDMKVKKGKAKISNCAKISTTTQTTPTNKVSSI